MAAQPPIVPLNLADVKTVVTVRRHPLQAVCGSPLPVQKKYCSIIGGMASTASAPRPDSDVKVLVQSQHPCDLKHILAGNKAYLGRAQGRKFVANVCVVRVAKVSGDSMNRKRFIRFKRLFQEFFYSRGFTNP